MGVIELLVALTILASAFRGVLAGFDAGIRGVLLGFFVGAGVGWICSVTLVLLAGAGFVAGARVLGVNLNDLSRKRPEPETPLPPPTLRQRLASVATRAGLALLGISLVGLPIGVAWLASRAVAFLINWLWG